MVEIQSQSLMCLHSLQGHAKVREFEAVQNRRDVFWTFLPTGYWGYPHYLSFFDSSPVLLTQVTFEEVVSFSLVFRFPGS